MKVHLLYQDRDFDSGGGLPPGHEDMIQDLELTTLLEAMAAGDNFVYGVATKVLLASLHDPEAIRYRQRVLADCLAQPEVIREMYAVAVGALQDRRQLWGGYGGTYQNASSNLHGAVSHLEAYVARLRQTAEDRRRPCREIPLRRDADAVRHAAARAGRGVLRGDQLPPQAAAVPRRRADQRRARPG
jgi:hypothetical protein